jgi:hemerythrin-like domain-containing protein
MNPTDILMDEHRVIEQVLNCLEKINCLFPAANRAMKEPDQQMLITACEKVEAEELGQGTHEKYLALANRLADRFGVSRAASETPHGEHKCGH